MKWDCNSSYQWMEMKAFLDLEEMKSVKDLWKVEKKNEFVNENVMQDLG